MVQIAVPISTVGCTFPTREPAQVPGNCHLNVDEGVDTPDDDTSFIGSTRVSPVDIGLFFCTSLSTPGVGDVRFKTRLKTRTPGMVDGSWALHVGSMPDLLVALRVIPSGNTDYLTQSFTLTGPERALLTNYTLLLIRIAMQNTQAVAERCTALQIDLPDAGEVTHAWWNEWSPAT